MKCNTFLTQEDKADTAKHHTASNTDKTLDVKAVNN